MKLQTRFAALAVIAFGLACVLAAHADESHQETRITFSSPVQVPGMVLAPGTYTFKLVDPLQRSISR